MNKENPRNINKLNEKLIEAAKNAQLKKIKNLIKKGADLHAKNNKALIGASAHNNLDVIKFLIENGADIHAENNQALVNAAKYNFLEIVQYLAENGASINVRDNEPLTLASRRGYLGIVSYLVIEHNCDPKLALKIAEERHQKEVFDWCDLYIKRKDLNVKLKIDLLRTSDKVSAKKIKV